MTVHLVRKQTPLFRVPAHTQHGWIFPAQVTQQETPSQTPPQTCLEVCFLHLTKLAININYHSEYVVLCCCGFIVAWTQSGGRAYLAADWELLWTIRCKCPEVE